MMYMAAGKKTSEHYIKEWQNNSSIVSTTTKQQNGWPQEEWH